MKILRMTIEVKIEDKPDEEIIEALSEFADVEDCEDDGDLPRATSFEACEVADQLAGAIQDDTELWAGSEMYGDIVGYARVVSSEWVED